MHVQLQQYHVFIYEYIAENVQTLMQAIFKAGLFYNVWKDAHLWF